MAPPSSEAASDESDATAATTAIVSVPASRRSEAASDDSDASAAAALVSVPGMQTFHCCTFKGCRAKFKRPSKLKTHTYSHTGERPFRCSHVDCAKSFTRKEHLKRHVVKNHAHDHAANRNEPSDAVVVDPAAVATWMSAQRLVDVNAAAAAAADKFACENCGKAYANKYSLSKHMRKYRQRYPCPECGQVFHKRHLLRTHTAQHDGKSPWPCDKCDLSFKYPSALKKHLKTHEKYPCTSCDLKLSTWSSLVRHGRTHAAERAPPPPPSACAVCQKVFPTKQHLNTHKKSHDEMRDVFHCDHGGCPRYYFYERNLSQHASSYHGGVRFPCVASGCQRRFSSKQKLQRHVQAAHAAAAAAALRKAPKKRRRPPTKAEGRKERKDKGSSVTPMAAHLTRAQLPHSTARNYAAAAHLSVTTAEAKALVAGDVRPIDLAEIRAHVEGDAKLESDFLAPSDHESEPSAVCGRRRPAGGAATADADALLFFAPRRRRTDYSDSDSDAAAAASFDGKVHIDDNDAKQQLKNLQENAGCKTKVDFSKFVVKNG